MRGGAHHHGMGHQTHHVRGLGTGVVLEPPFDSLCLNSKTVSQDGAHKAEAAAKKLVDISLGRDV